MRKNIVMGQRGRSMIEMLGVLAIVGVLSVAGIAGYSKAMGKFKINKAMDQVSTLSANIKTMYANLGVYSTLNNTVAYQLNLFPDEMVRNCTGTQGAFLDILISTAHAEDTSTSYDNCVSSGINGKVQVNGNNGSSFTIEMDNINKEACIAFAGGEWGGSAGFASLKIEQGSLNSTTPAVTGSLLDFLISSAHAQTTGGDSIEIKPDTDSSDLFKALAKCTTCGSGLCKATWTFL